MTHSVEKVPSSLQPISTLRKRRFSLRVLIGFSFALAIGFIAIGFFRDLDVTRRAPASPIFLIFGVVGLLIFAAVGHALGANSGAFAATGAGVLAWLGLIILVFLGRDPLMAQLPIHIAAMICTVLAIGLSLLWKPRGPEIEPAASIERLISVKKDLEHNRQGPAAVDQSQTKE